LESLITDNLIAEEPDHKLDALRHVYSKQGGGGDEARQKPGYRDRIRYSCWALLYRTAGSVHTVACDRIGGIDHAVYARHLRLDA